MLGTEKTLLVRDGVTVTKKKLKDFRKESGGIIL